VAADRGVSVTVATSGDDADVTVSNVSKPTLGPGEAKAVAADVHCPRNRNVPVTVAVTVEAEGVTVSMPGDTTTRSFELDCGGKGRTTDPRFMGAGNFEFGATDAETVNVTYWTASKQGGEWTVDEQSADAEVETTNLRSQVRGPKFVAVYVHEWSETYVHPNYDAANGTVGNWGQGTQDADRVEGRPGFAGNGQ